MINFNVIGQTALYEQGRFDAILQEEALRLAAYLDSKNIPSIGIGFNLRDSILQPLVLSAFGINPANPLLDAVGKAREQYYRDELRKLFGRQYLPGQDSILSSALDSLMAQRATDPLLAALGSSRENDFRFDSTTDPRIQQIFDVAIVAYEARVDAWLANIPPSTERLVLVSMAYNGVINAGKSPSLRAAIVSGDRAEAWFEIRYNSNGGTSRSNGIAARRYRESETFGLFNASGVDDKGAKQAFRMYTAHLGDIAAYEIVFPPSLASNPSVTSIDDELAPARAHLISQFGRQQAISGDVLVGDDNDNSYMAASKYQLLGSTQADLIFGEGGDDTVSAGDGADVVYGGVGDDTLMGQGGDDILIGEAGADLLAGGEENDRLEGGIDHDIYFVEQGEGADTIKDSDGLGGVVFARSALAGGKKVVGTSQYRSTDGKFTYELSGTTLTVTLTNGNVSTDGSVVIEEFKNGDLGIDLLEDRDPSPPAPPAVPKPLRTAPIFQVPIPLSPIVLDLDGDGVETTAAGSGAYFDHQGDGLRERTGWIAPDDGFLVWDRNGDGAITTGAELFGSETILEDGSQAANGFVALADIDENTDGVVNGLDSAFANLRVWRDLDGDGQSSPGELFTLQDAGVLSIDVAYSTSTQVDEHGNELRLQGTYTHATAGPRAAIDVWFKVDPTYTTPTEVLSLPEEIRALPDIKGFGQVYDLRQAMARDSSGTLSALVQSYVSEPDSALRDQLAAQIVHKWTGSENAPADPIGVDIARKVYAIEAYSGQLFPRTIFGVINPLAVPEYGEAFGALVESVRAHLDAQSHLASLYGSVSYDIDDQARSLAADTSATRAVIDAQIALDPIAGTALLADFARSIVGLGQERQLDLSRLYAHYEAQDASLGAAVISAGRTELVGTSGSESLQAPRRYVGWGVYPALMITTAPYLIRGGDGNDNMEGGLGPNALLGGQGNDYLTGNGQGDILYGGSGNDTLRGKTGSDDYLFGIGDGLDVVIESSEDDGDVDRIVFRSNVSTADVSFAREARDLIVGVGSPGDELRVEGYFTGVGSYLNSEDQLTYSSGKYKLEQLTFADGSRWNLAEKLSEGLTLQGTGATDYIYGLDGNDSISGLGGQDTLVGGAGDDVLLGGDGIDVLYGELGDDVLDGGAGDFDTLIGGGGSDTYLLNMGYGTDYVNEAAPQLQESNRVHVGDALTANDIAIYRNQLDLVIEIAGTADRLIVANWSNTLSVSEIRFDDQSVLDLTYLWSVVNAATAGNDFIDGTEGNDYIDALDGMDSVRGLEGDDILFGGVGNDTLDGGPGQDLLDGGTGDDTLIGGAGNDVYMFGFGYGNDTVSDYDAEPGNVDAIRMGQDVATGDVRVYRNLTNLFLSILTTGDTITVQNFFLFEGSSFQSDAYKIELVEFADATVWDIATLRALASTPSEFDDYLVGLSQAANSVDGLAGNDQIFGGAQGDVLYGGAGNDYIFGNGGNDTFDGGSGNDTLVGNLGSDTYHFGNGYGFDSILDFGPSIDTVVLGTGITPAQVSVTSDGNNIFLSLNGGADRLALLSWFASDRFKIEAIVFEDQTVWDVAALESQLPLTGTEGNDSLVGTSAADLMYGLGGNDVLQGGDGDDTLSGGNGNDYLYGNAGSDTLIGGAGDDELYGDAGNDIYVFAPGFGEDRMWTDYLSSETIRFEGGIRPSDVIVTRPISGYSYGSDLRLLIAGTTDRLRVYGGPFNSVTVEFEDGTVWDEQTLRSKIVATDTDVADPVLGNDYLAGTTGDDTIDGLSGIDWIYGYEGNDTLMGGADADSISGGAGNDTIRGGAGDDSIGGQDGSDTYVFDKGDGRDLLWEAGNPTDVDRLLLGDGIDAANTIVFRNQDSLYFEFAGSGEGIRVVDWFFTYSGDPYQRKLESIEFADGTVWNSEVLDGAPLGVVATGSSPTFGTSGADIIVNLSLGAYLDGLEGADTMIGGVWATTYVVDNIGDRVIEPMDGSGVDAVYSYITWSIDASIETLALLGNGAIDGFGNERDNVLYGNSNDNALDGAGGADVMAGWTGNDRYYVDNPGDVVTENYDEGIDSVYSSISWTLTSNVENLILVGSGPIDGTGNALANEIVGNESRNTLDGKAGADVLVGGAGDDSYIVDDIGDVVVELPGQGSDTVYSSVSWVLGSDVENLILTGWSSINGTGNALKNTIVGNIYDNILDGGGGADTLVGGAGYDTYIVDDPGDVVVEEDVQGIDTVKSYISYLGLPDYVENLVLLGGEIGVGNALNNWITGNAGDNQIDGLAGADQMYGGPGNDTYWVDDPGDGVHENAGEGIDTVISSVSFVLPGNDEIENLTLIGTAGINGTGNLLNNIIIGNAGNNTLQGSYGDDWLDGGDGNDTLFGGAGNDTYVVAQAGDVTTENASEGTDTVRSSITWTLGSNIENLVLTGTSAINGTGNSLDNTLTGNGADNTLTGGSGNDWLDGGAGNDTMIGGAGNDTYIVDQPGDITSESSSQGTDTVRSSISWTLASNVENLVLTGTADINGTGNTLANVITGNSGNNVLNGGSGADTMVGGLGDDTYIVDSTSDQVIENLNEGIDTISTALSWTLGANIENLTLTGSSGVSGTGNILDNTIIGNSGRNTLTGGAGNDWLDGGTNRDTLIGGTGDDTYVVDHASDAITENAAEGVDTVRSTLAWTLGSNLENLVLVGTANINGTGNALANILTGNAGNNTLTGNAGNDTLDGQAGSDTLIGGTGNDTYLLGRGYGADLIQENDATSGNTDIGQFLENIAPDQIWFRQSGTNLEVSIIGTPDKFTVQNWYSGSQYRVEQFRTSSGQTLMEAQVQNLVNAMAAFAPPAPGQETLPPNYAAALNPVIAANWQ